jgi:transposase
MRRRPPRLVELGTEERMALRALVKDGHTEQRVARRARALLAMAEPSTVVGALAERLDLGRSSIWSLCRRYEACGVFAVYDAPRSGRPPSLSPPAARASRAARVL